MYRSRVLNLYVLHYMTNREKAPWFLKPPLVGS
jgi:hypothetical protein